MSWFKLEVILIMAAYALLILIFLLGRRMTRQNEKKRSSIKKSNSITVIIPFRNEENNLKKLVESINNLSSHAHEYVFINDNSEDSSLEVLKDLSVPYKILELTDQVGKKHALTLGVENANSDYIITWDADVTIPVNYFQELNKYDWSDLMILPVKMLGPDFIPGFFAMDYQLQTQANISVSAIFRPITASGANLFFKKSVFIEMETLRNDVSTASGDDQFLLKACRESGKKISVVTNENLCVKTYAPKSIQLGMQQRMRWLGKTKKVGDSFANIFGFIVLIVQLSYYSFAWYQTIIGDWGATLVMILIKGELDAFLATYKFQEQFNTLKVFLYQLIYPIYILALIFGTPFVQVKWKDRKIA